MAKHIQFDDQARQALRRGVDQLANAIKVTLGPRGRNVVIERRNGTPIITNDGVTIAREIELADPFENLGVQLMKEVAHRTGEIAGDGTTTATILAQSIIGRGLQAVAAGANPTRLKKGIESAVDAAVRDLERQSKPVRSRATIAQVATVAANDDASIGELLAEAMTQVGRDGVISVEEARGVDTTLEVVEGMQFARGYLSPYFVSDAERMTAVLDDAWVLITDRKIAAVKELLPALDEAAKAGRPLLVIAEDVESEALAILVVNKLRGTIASVAVKAPEFGDRRNELLEDIAVLTGGRVITGSAGRALESVGARDFGRVKRAEVDRDSTTLVEGGGRSAEIRSHIASLKNALEGADSDYDRQRLRERLAKLSGGVAVIHVGGTTELELRERKSRVEDALAATRSAVQEGIVPGGGVALMRARAAVAAVRTRGDASQGRDIVAAALLEPCRQIAENAGMDGPSIVRRVQDAEGALGFNAISGRIEDLFKAGIIDPTQVVRAALQNAASIGALVLTTDVMVTDAPAEEGEPPAAEQG